MNIYEVLGFACVAALLLSLFPGRVVVLRFSTRTAMRAAIACVVALACAFVVYADPGEVNLAWDASDGATGYRVYLGTATGVYGDAILDVTNNATPVATLQDGCVQQFMAVTAYNILGESAFSNEIVVFPRPIFLGTPSLSGVPPDQVIVISGGNFAPGITLTFNNQPAPFTVHSCTLIHVPVLTVPGLGQGQPVTLQLCNGPVCQSGVLLPVTEPQALNAS